MRSIKEIYYNRGSKRQSLMAYLTMAIMIAFFVFIIVVSSIFINVYKTSLYNSAKINAEQAVSLAADMIHMNLYTITNDLSLIAERVVESDDENELKRDLNSIVSVRSGIGAIMVYDKTGKLLTYGSDGSELKNNIKNNLSYLPSVFESEKNKVSAPHVQNLFGSYYPWVVTTGDEVYSEYYKENVYLAIDIPFTSVLSYINSVNIGEHGYCFVMDKDGVLVYHPQQQLIFSGLKTENIEDIINMADGTTAKGDKIYSVKTISEDGWRVVGVSFTNEMINSKVTEVYRNVIMLALLGIIILIIVITVVSVRVSRPIKELTYAMEAFEKEAEQFEYVPVKGMYEVESLSRSFDHMVAKIKQLMNKIIDEEKTLRKTELKALQSQINPHFLYNTLDSIQWMCEKGETDKAIIMVSALAKLFRISISKGKEMITIEQELNHVRNYLVIQSYRFKNQFNYKFDVDESLLGNYCNKITLQPIVENAVIHGVDGLSDEGEITISVKADGDRIIMKIADNGIGMTKEQCEKIINHDESDNFGIGIKNVNDRLKIYFGEEFGLKIDSELDVGTTVTICIPKITEEDIREEARKR